MNKTDVVHQIPCRDCASSYIRETGRTLKKRIAEHKAAVRRGDCHGNFGPENFGPGDRNSTKMFRGISVLSWNLSPPVNKIRNDIRK